MVNLDALSDEELVRQARAAFEANRAEDFSSAAGVLLKRYEKAIAGRVYRRLSARGAERLFKDVVQDVNREILAQLQAPRLKPALRVMFKLTVNTTCRDVVEIALRHEGYTVQSRHATPRVAKRPDAVPYAQRVSLDQPVDVEHDDTLLQETIADDSLPSPDAVAISNAERLEWMRNLSPEQRLMIAIYGDYQERRLKAEVIAARRGLPVAEVKRYYTEACRILQQNKEHRDE
jgi:hypothetical protein